MFKKPALTLDASLVQDDQPLEVVPKVYVGSIHSAFNLDTLVLKGITHILNASRIPGTFPKDFTYLSVEIRDKDDSNLLACIPTTNIFIEAGIDHGGILVHCFGGKSRSPAFICAFLMSSYSWTFDRAYEVVKVARPSADINVGFECQLRAYEAARYDVYVAQQLLLRARIRDLHLLKGDKALVDQFIPNKKTPHASDPSDSTSHQPNSVSSSVPMLLSGKQQRFDSMTAENWQLATAHGNVGPSPNTKRSLLRGRSALGESIDETTTSMDVDNNTDGEESSSAVLYRSPLGKAQSRNNLDADCSSRIKAIKIEDASHPSQGGTPQQEHNSHAVGLHLSTPVSSSAMALDTALEDSLDSQMSKDSADNTTVASNSSGSRAAAAHSTGPSATSTYASNDFVQSLSKVPVNFHTGSGGSGGKTSRHRTRHGSGGGSSSNGNNNNNHHHSSHSSSNNHNNNNSSKTINKNPSCRLSRPGSHWVRVIPPLRGLEREFKCSWCNVPLFQLSSVIRLDINVTGMIDAYLLARQACFLRQLTTDPSLREDPEEQFLKSKSSSSSHGGHKEKFNDTLMAALKKSTSNMRLLQSSSGTSPKEQHHTSHFLPPINGASLNHHHNNNNNNVNSNNSNSGTMVNLHHFPTSAITSTIQSQHQQHSPPLQDNGSTTTYGYLSSVSAPVTVTRIGMLPRQYSRGFHDVGAMDEDSQSHGKNVEEEEEDEEASMPVFSRPLMTTRHAKAPSKGFGFDDVDMGSDDPPAATATASKSFGSDNHNGNSSARSLLQKLPSGSGSSASGAADAQRVFTPRQLSGLQFSNNTDSSGNQSQQQQQQPQSHNSQAQSNLFPSISSNPSLSSPRLAISQDGLTGGTFSSHPSESTPPPFLHTLSTGSTSESRGTSPRYPPLLSSVAPMPSNTNNHNAHSSQIPLPSSNPILMSASERSPSQQYFKSLGSSSSSSRVHSSRIVDTNNAVTSSANDNSNNPTGSLPRLGLVPSNQSRPHSASSQHSQHSQLSTQQPPHNALPPATTTATAVQQPSDYSSGISRNADRPNSANSIFAQASNNNTNNNSNSSSNNSRRDLLLNVAVSAPHPTGSSSSSSSSSVHTLLPLSHHQHQLLLHSSGSHLHDDSPRVMVPPTKMFDGASAHDRPRSAEKMRWLARAALLKEGDMRVAHIAEADDVASRLAFDQDPYFHVEYLEWMGKELFQMGYDHGDICCPGCKHVVGSWTWTPSMRLTRNGNLEAPLFRIKKSIVHHMDLDFDATPGATPRMSEEM